MKIMTRCLSTTIIGGALALTGCAPTTTILPLGSNQFRAITSSSSRSTAYETTMKNATKQCQQLGRKIIVVSSHNTYSGLNKQQKMISSLASDFTSAISGGHSGLNSSSSDDDNQVVVQFKCVK